MKTTIIVLITCLLLNISGFAQKVNKNGDAILGRWMSAANDFEVEVYKETNGTYAAKIIWFVVVTKGKNINDVVDKHNPNAKLRTRKWLGLQTLEGLNFDGKNKWVDGKIYVPKTGKTYNAKCTLANKNTLEVRGYIGISLLGETIKFIRVK
jgi:uncharacterized protein (DUF2147 family)